MYGVFTYIYHLNYLNLNRPSIEYPMVARESIQYSAKGLWNTSLNFNFLYAKHVTPKSVACLAWLAALESISLPKKVI